MTRRVRCAEASGRKTMAKLECTNSTARTLLLLCMCLSLCLSANAAARKSSKTAKSSRKSSADSGKTGGESKAQGAQQTQGQQEQEPAFPMIVDDTRFFNNQTQDRSGPPLKISIASQEQYSRIFFSGSEGQLATTLLEELLPTDTVLDLGAEVGVFSLTAARKGVRQVTAIESDMALAASLEQSVEINALNRKVLVLTWIPSSSQGYATVFAKAGRGCVYSGAHTTNHSTDEFTRGVYTAPTRSIDEAIQDHLIDRPTIVRLSMEGAEEFALEGMDSLLSHPELAPRAILIIVYPYQLRRVLQWISVRGYSPARDPPGDLPEELVAAWQQDTIDWEDPLMLEWYKLKVYNFFGAQVGGGDIQGESFLFYKVRASQYKGHFFRRASSSPPAPAPAADTVRSSGGGGSRSRRSSRSSAAGTKDQGVGSRGREEGAAAGGARGGGFSISWKGDRRSGGLGVAVPSFGGSTGVSDGDRAGMLDGGWGRGGGEYGGSVEGGGRGEAGEEGEEGEEGGMSEAPLTLVTAVSTDFFDRLHNLIGSVHSAEPDLPIVVYDMGLTRAQRKTILTWDGVELKRYPFERYPAHVQTLANYAWKLPLVKEAVQELTNILYLDSSIELRGPIDEIREMLAGEGYFFTTQGCNLSDNPDVPCDPQEACTVGDKTPPGVIKELFGIEDKDSPHLFKPCIAGGLMGINIDTPRGRRVLKQVIEPAVGCSIRLTCIYPPEAVAIINSNFDMAPLGLLVHAAALRYRGERRFNAALYSALHTPEPAGRDAGVVLYTRRRFKGIDYLPFKDFLRLRAGPAPQDDDLPLVTSYSRNQTGLLYQTPASVSRANSAAMSLQPVYPMTVLPPTSPSSSTSTTSGDGRCRKQDVRGLCSDMHSQPQIPKYSGGGGGVAGGSEEGGHGGSGGSTENAGGSGGGGRKVRAGQDGEEEVYVSIILSARNDGHEGNFMLRLQTSLDQLAAAGRMYPSLSAELVLVEWAPPPHRPSLRRALRWPRGLPRVRIIKVPPAVHDALPQAAQDAFPQFFAKNVGMRRARGKYMLVTNGDVLLGHALIEILARRDLLPDAFYRIDRHDLHQRFHPSMRGGDMTEACMGAIKKVMTMQRMGVGQLLSDAGLDWESMGELHRTSHGHLRITFPDDILVRTQYWDAVTLLGQGPIVQWPQGDGSAAVEEQSLQERLSNNPNAHLLVPLNSTGKTDAGLPAEMPELHTYADGDFFLAPSLSVRQVRGYPEIPLPVLVDSYLTVATAAAGYKQHIFMPPACIFHQFHPQGSMPQRVAQTVGQPEIEAFIRNVTWMLSNRLPLILNDENWGYAQHQFEEEEFVAEGKHT